MLDDGLLMCLTEDSVQDSWRLVCYRWTRGINFQYGVALGAVSCVAGTPFVIGRFGNGLQFEDAIMRITVVAIVALAVELRSWCRR